MHPLREEGEAVGGIGKALDFTVIWVNRLMFPVYLIYTPYILGAHIANADYDWRFLAWIIVGPFMIMLTGMAWFTADRYGNRNG